MADIFHSTLIHVPSGVEGHLDIAVPVTFEYEVKTHGTYVVARVGHAPFQSVYRQSNDGMKRWHSFDQGRYCDGNQNGLLNAALGTAPPPSLEQRIEALEKVVGSSGFTAHLLRSMTPRH